MTRHEIEYLSVQMCLLSSVELNGPMSDMERLELFEKLEKAEGRIVALEKQVKHSAALLHFLEMWRFALSDMS